MDPIETPRPIFKRSESFNISNQGFDKTCYAHTSTRVILKLIRRVIPELFTPFINDECNQDYKIYLNESINLFFEKINRGECGESSKNYFLIFIFIYTSIVERPIRFARPAHVFYWFETNLENLIHDKNIYEIMKTKYPSFTSDQYDIIIHILNIFFQNINVKSKYNGMETIMFETGTNLELATNVLRYYLDKEFYFGLVSDKFHHAVTVTGYSFQDGEFCLEIKNSWGRTNTDSRGFVSTHVDGIVTEKFKDLLQNFNSIETIVPVRIDDEDIPNQLSRNPSLDETDAKYRAIHKARVENKMMGEQDIKRAGKKRKSKKKSKRKSKKKSKRKSK